MDFEQAQQPPEQPLLGAGRHEERATTLVVMEAGALWPSWVKELQQRAPNSMVEVQPAGESPMDFAKRVERRIQSMRSRGVLLRAACYAAASPAGSEEKRGRARICSALLGGLGTGAEGQLVLAGSGWSNWGVDALSREELMILAGELSCQLSTPSPTISVRFSDSPLESGVHKAASRWLEEGADRDDAMAEIA